MKHLLCVVLTVSAGSAALGQVTPIGPFSGPYREGFETQPVVLGNQYSCLPGRIFNNTASICEPTSNSLVIPATWGLVCQATPHQGSRFAVGANGWVEINFDAPTTAFGGYFATVGGINGGEFSFHNGSVTVGAALMYTNNCQWNWQGWSTTTPFTRVKIWGAGIIGSNGYIHMDDLEYLGQGQPPCYANCDGSTSSPRLTANDFACFVSAYASGQPSANCDGSTGAPRLTANDFVCFISAYAAGCP